MEKGGPSVGRAADFRAATVKIHSKSDAGLIEFRGSGTAFREKGRCYVLTSDHVVLHAEKKHRHWVEGGVSASAHFLAASWERGLALLELETTSCGALSLTDFAPGASTSEPAGVFGYPWDVTERMDCQDGRVTNPAEPNEIFVAVPKLVRVEGCHGEFGMSGGPTSARSGSFLGVLSHQKLLDAGSDADTLLVIPAADVYAWLRSYFDVATYRYSLIQSPQIQLEKREEVISQNVWFSIGRYLSLDPSRREICANAWTQSYTPAAYADPGGYFPRVRDHAGDGCVYIVGFRENKFLGKFVRRFSTLVQFFRLFARADLQPIVLLPSGKKPGELFERLKRETELAGCRSDGGPLCTALREIAERIEPSPHTTGEVSYWLVTPGDLSYLLTAVEFADEWARLGDAPELKRVLASLRDTLSAVTF